MSHLLYQLQESKICEPSGVEPTKVHSPCDWLVKEISTSVPNVLSHEASLGIILLISRKQVLEVRVVH